MLDTTYGGNTFRAYLVAIAVFAAIVLAIRIARQILVRRVGRLTRRTETRLDDTIIGMVSATKMWLAIFIAFYAASLFLVLPADRAHSAHTAAVIALLIQIGFWANAAIGATIARLRDKKLSQGETAGIGVLALIGFFARLLAWVVLILLILDNLGVNVTALVAGLGIGGVAIALAVQNVLQDLFASISIMLDRPFEIGDPINVDGLAGTVQQIGIKTTRVRSLDGEELVFSNADLLKSRIRNFRRMKERRVLFILGVERDTPVALVEKLPGVFRDIIQREDKARFDRAHFKGFGQFSLDFEVVYFVTTSDYVAFMDTHQRVNLEIMRQLAALGVSLALPARTVYYSRATGKNGKDGGDGEDGDGGHGGDGDQGGDGGDGERAA